MPIVPIKKVIRNKRVLSLLESQFSKSTELGIELVETSGVLGWRAIEYYRLYTKRKGEDNDCYTRNRFIINRTVRQGRIREYSIGGSIIIMQ